MVTSVFFNNFQASNEQGLLEDLIIESIRIYGHDVYYLPQTLGAKDQIYGESDVVSFNSAYMIEMYIEDFDGTGFTMDKNFLSKFGLEIHNQVIFSVSMRVFQEDVASEERILDLTRPREGDIIFYTLTNRPFIITYVDKFPMYYQLGALQTWRITCELFNYSGETFNTGIGDIDALNSKSMDVLHYTLRDENGDFLVDENGDYIVDEQYADAIELVDESAQIQRESDVFVDFTVIDPFSEGNI